MSPQSFAHRSGRYLFYSSAPGFVTAYWSPAGSGKREIHRGQSHGHGISLQPRRGKVSYSWLLMLKFLLFLVSVSKKVPQKMQVYDIEAAARVYRTSCIEKVTNENGNVFIASLLLLQLFPDLDRHTHETRLYFRVTSFNKGFH